MFLLLTWTYFTPFSNVSIVDFEQVNVSWDLPIDLIKQSYIVNSFLKRLFSLLLIAAVNNDEIVCLAYALDIFNKDIPVAFQCLFHCHIRDSFFLASVNS